MKISLKKIIFAIVVVAILVALLAPFSPVNLPDYLARNTHNGRSISDWVRDVKSKNNETRGLAIMQVGKIGPEAKEAIPELGRLLVTDEDVNIRAQAAFSLSKMAPETACVVSELAKALNDPEPAVRLNACRALQSLKAEGKPAIPALLAALKDESNHINVQTNVQTVHQLILRTLGAVSVGTPEAVSTLLTYLDPDQPRLTRVVVLLSFKDIGEPIRPLAPKLRTVAKDEDVEIRMLATEALKGLGEPIEGPTEGFKAAEKKPEAPGK